MTAIFDVIVNGEEVYSHQRGQGPLDSEEKWALIIDAINHTRY